MKIKINKTQIPDPEMFIRRCGYGRVVDRRAGKISYAHRLHGDLYPRFHVYIEDAGDFFSLNLHLDQRATRYEGVTAHAGEYEGEVVEREAVRIQQFLAKNEPVTPGQDRPASPSAHQGGSFG